MRWCAWPFGSVWCVYLYVVVLICICGSVDLPFGQFSIYIACTIHTTQYVHIKNVYSHSSGSSVFFTFLFFVAKGKVNKWMHFLFLFVCIICVTWIYSLAFGLRTLVVSLCAFLVHIMCFLCICQRNHKQIPKTTATIATCFIVYRTLQFTIHNTPMKQIKQTNNTKQFRIQLKQWMCRHYHRRRLFHFISFHSIYTILLHRVLLLFSTVFTFFVYYCRRIS